MTNPKLPKVPSNIFLYNTYGASPTSPIPATILHARYPYHRTHCNVHLKKNSSDYGMQ